MMKGIAKFERKYVKKHGRNNKSAKKEKYSQMPQLTPDNPLTRIIAEQGSLIRRTIIYCDEEQVYNIRPKQVKKAIGIMNDNNMSFVNHEQRKERLFRPVFREKDLLINIISKYALNCTHHLYYEGKRYIIYKGDRKTAKNLFGAKTPRHPKIYYEKREDKRSKRKKKKSVKRKPKVWPKFPKTISVCGRVEYIEELPELKPHSIITEEVAKCNINHQEIKNIDGKYYGISPPDVKRAKLIVDEQMKLNRESRRSSTWAEKVKERDNYTCQHCGSGEKLHAHHILGFAQHPEKAQVVDNGITLCEKCHGRFHTLHGIKNFGEKELEVFLKYDR